MESLYSYCLMLAQSHRKSLFDSWKLTCSFIFYRKMRYVAAYLLAALGGNEAPTAENIEKILSSVGIEAEADKLSKVIAELKGKSLQTLIAEGEI